MITYTHDSGEVRVSPTMEALGEQPYICEIVPNNGALPTETIVIKIADFPFMAADLALTKYKEKHNLNPSTMWNL